MAPSKTHKTANKHHPVIVGGIMPHNMEANAKIIKAVNEVLILCLIFIPRFFVAV